MEVIMIHHPQPLERAEFPPLSMALGFFDGVHKGHQEVIGQAIGLAKEHGCKSAVMTFDPHPSIVLSKEKKQVQYITPLADKIELIRGMGVDYLFIVRFTSAFASLDPQTFIDLYAAGLNVKYAVAGFDYTYGKFGKGTMETMPEHAKGRFEVTVVPKQEMGDEKVSSTRIRALIAEGNVAEAAALLGRFYSTKGTVIHGEKRGSKIGFPTANIQVGDGYIIPGKGVYAVRILVAGKVREGVCNVGYKPTFKDPGQSELSVEVHIIDFGASIYGEEVRVEWCARIRDERKFSGIEELIAQIGKDKETARGYFKSLRDNA